MYSNEDKDYSCKMFFIAKGSCQVKIRTENDARLMKDDDETHQNLGKLMEGAHFGEISLIFNCPRTATVSCNNYCTLAVISKKKI